MEICSSVEVKFTGMFNTIVQRSWQQKLCLRPADIPVCVRHSAGEHIYHARPDLPLKLDDMLVFGHKQHVDVDFVYAYLVDGGAMCYRFAVTDT